MIEYELVRYNGQEEEIVTNGKGQILKFTKEQAEWMVDCINTPHSIEASYKALLRKEEAEEINRGKK